MSRLGLVLVMVGCTPLPGPNVAPPAAPIIRLPEQPPGEPWRALTVTVRIETEDQTVVRLFASPGCTGSELRRVSSDEARAGFTLDTVQGDNVFSAEAVSQRGERSPCSGSVTLPVRLRLRSLQVPTPFVRETVPPSPTRELVVRIRGFASLRSTVSVWAGPNCEAPRLGQGTAEAFADEGIAVTLIPNGTLTVSLDAQEGDVLSFCSQRLVLVNDQTRPMSNAFLFPRPPSAARVGVVVVSDIDGRPLLYSGSACRSPLGFTTSTFCAGRGCDAYLFPVVFAETPVVSVGLRDRGGNESGCATLEFQRSTGLPPAYFAEFFMSAAGTTLLLAPGSNPEVPEVFVSEQCGFGARRASYRLAQPQGTTAVAVYGDFPAAGPVSLGWRRLNEIVDCQRLR